MEALQKTVLKLCGNCFRLFVCPKKEANRPGRYKNCQSCSKEFKKQFLRHGTGPDNPNWRGGRSYHSKGYVYVYNPGHRLADKHGYVLEHLLVAEKMLGRELKEGEVVHHRNGKKDDNREENLFVFPNVALHTGFHEAKKKNPGITEEEFMKGVQNG